MINIDENTNELNITPKLELYLDHDRNKTIEDIKKFDREFKNHTRSFLDLGYIVTSSVWIKVTFENNSTKDIEKILGYSDELVSKYFLYKEDGELIGKQGVHIRAPRLENIRNYFYINISANTKKTYYIYLSTEYSSTHGMLQVWDVKKFFKKEALYILVLTAFFASMLILLIYNTFLYLFSKDKVYLHYIFYLFIVTFHHICLTGYLYMFIDVDTKKYFENVLFTLFIINFIFIASVVFIKSFLETNQYPKINFGLNLFLWVTIISTIYFTISGNFTYLEWDINIMYIGSLYLIFVGWYALFRGNFNARYYVIGWGFVILAFIMLILHHIGVYPFKYEFPYLVEVLFLAEAILFSVALAHKLKRLQSELITQQQTEQVRLQKEVTLKTDDLNKALQTKDHLLKELHHRVKNNMQIIISMIRMQYRKIDEIDTMEKFIEIENRINSMSRVHELLYDGDTLDNESTRYYLETLIENIQSSFIYEHEIDIDIRGECNFDMDRAIYLGLIINELVFNSMKYAFNKEVGEINISLKRIDEEYLLIVEDNGIGFDKDRKSNTLGLRLVNTLATEQLKGEIDISSNQGTKVEVRFK